MNSNTDCYTERRNERVVYKEGNPVAYLWDMYRVTDASERKLSTFHKHLDTGAVIPTAESFCDRYTELDRYTVVTEPVFKR